ncbi:hypothetical protein GCM10009760_01650 [Kitasatospora kazusensis]|uniref:Uncharacterized protein n=1 Tax=Kitasatospora kazusensis TaxID=407974 RepID=A0ABN2YNC1_9ACTN
MFGRRKKTPQQRRADANRAADRTGHAAINARPENRPTTPKPGPAPRAWWRS